MSISRTPLVKPDNPDGYRPAAGAGSGTLATSGEVEDRVEVAEGGYEFTGGFKDRQDGQSGANDIGSNVDYTARMANDGLWYRFGFDVSAQDNNDNIYWNDPNSSALPGFDQTKGLFGSLYMPAGVTNLVDFSFDDTSGFSASAGGSLAYTSATGSFDFTQCKPGDLALIRFDFNVVPREANTTVQVGLIWSTRDSNDDITFTFPLTTQPIFFGTGTVGQEFLCRPLITAYFASNEDVNARALLAIKADTQVYIQPLTTLVTILR